MENLNHNKELSPKILFSEWPSKSNRKTNKFDSMTQDKEF